MTPRGDPSFPHGDHHKHDARPTAHRLWLFSDRLLVGKPERFLFNERDFFAIAIDAPLAALGDESRGVALERLGDLMAREGDARPGDKTE